ARNPAPIAGTAGTENAPPVMTAVPYKRSHAPGSRVNRPARASTSVRRAPTASGGAKLSTNFRPGPERIGSPAARAFRIPVTSPSARAAGPPAIRAQDTIRGMRRHALVWCMLGLACLIGALATLDRSRQVGRPYAGFWVMENLLVAIGGAERGGLEPFDLVRVVNGQVPESGRQIQAEIARHPPGTALHYIVYRRGQLAEADIRTEVTGR